MHTNFVSRPWAVLAVVVAAALLAACANGRTVIDLPPPPAAGVAPARAPAVRIADVTDDRVFQDRPHQPSIPSLDGEGASKAPPALRAHAVARKRNGYGMAQGDVVLSEREDMRDVVRANLALALVQAGYRVDDRDPSARRVDIHVRDFWLWLEPHTLVGVIRSRIVTDVAIEGAPPVTVAAETDQPGQIFSQEAWTNAVGVAVAAWRTRAASDLRP
jgi:hypothetical protein